MDALYESDFRNMEFPFMLTISSGENPFLYHWHDEIEFVYVLEENVDVGISSSLYHLQAGDIIFVPSGIRHCFFSAPANSRRLAIKFSPSLLEAACGAEIDTLKQIFPHSQGWSTENASVIRDMLLELQEEYQEQRIGYRCAISSTLHRIILTIIRNLSHNTITQPSRKQKTDVIKKILAYLSTHYMEKINLQTCADSIGFNPNYLSRTFYQQTGIHFHTYLQILRLRNVEWLLLNTQDTILSIAEQCGYPNVKTLNRVFLDKCGCTPSAYRKSVQ